MRANGTLFCQFGEEIWGGISGRLCFSLFRRSVCAGNPRESAVRRQADWVGTSYRVGDTGYQVPGYRVLSLLRRI